MSTLAAAERHFGHVPTEALRLLSEIDQAKGKQNAYRHQFPEQLKALQQIARVQSTEASNAIEGIEAPKQRIEAIVADKTTPQNRPEEEIAGYRKVLDLIHSINPGRIPFSENVLQLRGGAFCKHRKDHQRFQGDVLRSARSVDSWVGRRRE